MTEKETLGTTNDMVWVPLESRARMAHFATAFSPMSIERWIHLYGAAEYTGPVFRAYDSRFSVLVADEPRKVFFSIVRTASFQPLRPVAATALVQGSVGDSFEAAVACVKQLFDAVTEGRLPT